MTRLNAPPELPEVDVLRQKLLQKPDHILVFQMDLAGFPWQAVLDNKSDEVNLVLLLELGALPFSAESREKRIASLAVLENMNLSWEKNGHSWRIGVSPGRNTVHLMLQENLKGQPGIETLFTAVANHILSVQGALLALKTCNPWLFRAFGVKQPRKPF